MEAFDRLLGRGQLALDVKARRKLVLGSLALAIRADPFGLEHRALSFEQRAQIGGQLCKSGRIEARHHATQSISCEAPRRTNKTRRVRVSLPQPERP
ncbi:hypothetical protein [Methylocystis sp. S23]